VFSRQVCEKIIHTGQHFDPKMSAIFFSELSIKAPFLNLGISDCGHGEMTGRMLAKIEQILLSEKPEMVIVFGDTNSTLAGALAAAKLNVPVAHVEAGLRSFNKSMPEEINRILTDHVSSYLLCPTKDAVANLENEGISKGVLQVGDVMYDASKFYSEKAKKEISLGHWGLQAGNYVLSTIHRAENTDDMQRLENIMYALRAISADKKVVLPLHPRTKAKLEEFRLLSLLEGVLVIPPVSYLEMARLEIDAHAIITDSGGVQKEAFFYQVPCLTLREETEWVETVNLGWNKLCSANKDIIMDNWISLDKRDTQNCAPYGDGDASEKIVEYLFG
jgi:UDP-GlcNAc3NAcA epimerase